MNKNLLPLLVFGALVGVSSSSLAGRALVDDFSGSTINYEKWSSWDATIPASQFRKEIDTTAGNLVLGVGRNGLYRAESGISRVDPTALQATIAVISATPGNGEVGALIAGDYYNTKVLTPTNALGTVYANVIIGDRGNGLEAWGNIAESTHSDFETWIETEIGIISPGTLTLNTPYVSKIAYDGERSFTFTVDGVSETLEGPVRIGTPNTPGQSLNVSGGVLNSTAQSIQATFDDVYADNSVPVFDSFSGTHIDSSKWQQYGGRREVVGGKLALDVSSDNIMPSDRRDTTLHIKARNPIYVEAKVMVSSDSVLDSGLEGRARLSGYFYNERRDGGATAQAYNGSDGDVWGRVGLRLSDGVLTASAYLESHLVDYAFDKELLYQAFTKQLAVGTEYLLSIQRDGSKLIFSLDDEKIEYTITSEAYPPSTGLDGASGGYRRFKSRINGTQTSSVTGAKGIFKVLIDDVFVEASATTTDATTPDSGGGGAFGLWMLALFMLPAIRFRRVCR
jgi:hypothetical protein